MSQHTYRPTVRWTGNLGTGTSGFRAYSRDHLVEAGARPPILGSSDAAFNGDPGRWDPEDLLVVSLAQCHMLWYLHLAAVSGVVVTDYRDEPVGTMAEEADGGGCFTRVLLRPTVTVADLVMVPRAGALHADAHATCFIARSVAFPVECQAEVKVATSGAVTVVATSPAWALTLPPPSGERPVPLQPPASSPPTCTCNLGRRPRNRPGRSDDISGSTVG